VNTTLVRCAALLGCLAVAACAPETELPSPPPPPQAQPQPGAERGTAALPDFSALMEQQGPAVVNVITRTAADESPWPFNPGRPPGQTEGMGSGFIITADGYILTNAHVVADAQDVIVRLANAKRELRARVVGTDRRTDVALLKVDTQNLPTVRLGHSAKVRPGQWVAAIGSPFGFDNTITSGIVSATDRALPGEAFVPFIQTDVPLNPGNSGGPLLTASGEVVGINSMIYSGTGGYMGVSFAIPIELAMDIARQLQSAGKVTRGRIGVAAQPMTRELARAFSLDEPNGVVITSVEPGGPANRAGIEPGDVVVSFGGAAVEGGNDLPRLVAGTKPGQTAPIDILRNGKRERLQVTTDELPAQEVPTAARARAPEPKPRQDGRLGAMVSELPPAERKKLGVDYGLIVQAIERPGVPLQPGDVIIGVNRSRFASLEEFTKLLAAHKGATVALLVRRGLGAIYVPVDLG
jgi:serine protease Do